MGYHLIAMDWFACPSDLRSSVVWALGPWLSLPWQTGPGGGTRQERFRFSLARIWRRHSPASLGESCMGFSGVMGPPYAGCQLPV